MAKIIKKSFDNKVTPKGLAKWVKVNSRYDEYEGKKKYSVTLRFPNKDDEARMKKFCDDTLAAAKKLAEFEGRTWRSGDDLRNGYSVAQDGSLEFKFQTGAFYTDRETGEKMQKFIPVFNVATQSKLPHDVNIGDGSELRISFMPMAYWMTKDSNGLNMYINKIVVDKLIEYGNSDDFSEFGIEMPVREPGLDEEDVPI